MTESSRSEYGVDEITDLPQSLCRILKEAVQSVSVFRATLAIYQRQTGSESACPAFKRLVQAVEVREAVNERNFARLLSKRVRKAVVEIEKDANACNAKLEEFSPAAALAFREERQTWGPFLRALAKAVRLGLSLTYKQARQCPTQQSTGYPTALDIGECEDDVGISAALCGPLYIAEEAVLRALDHCDTGLKGSKKSQRLSRRHFPAIKSVQSRLRQEDGGLGQGGNCRFEGVLVQVPEGADIDLRLAAMMGGISFHSSAYQSKTDKQDLEKSPGELRGRLDSSNEETSADNVEVASTDDLDNKTLELVDIIQTVQVLLQQGKKGKKVNLSLSDQQNELQIVEDKKKSKKDPRVVKLLEVTRVKLSSHKPEVSLFMRNENPVVFLCHCDEDGERLFKALHKITHDITIQAFQ